MADPFTHRLRVRFQECDPQGVVYFARYLDFADIAITELFRERLGGYAEMVGRGVDAVVAESGVRHHAPARFDDELDITVTVARLGTTSATYRATMRREGELVAEATVRHVHVATGTHAKAPIPGDVRAVLGELAEDAGAAVAGGTR